MSQPISAAVSGRSIGLQPRPNATACALAEASELYFRDRRIERPDDLAQSFALRHQVYCEEMKFLDSANYHDALETDAYDECSWHFGSFNMDGMIVGTVRLVEDRGGGLPMNAHCTLFPDERERLRRLPNVMEISRLAVSPRYRRRKGDGSWGLPEQSAVIAAPLPPGAERRHPVFPTVVRLYRVMYHAMKTSGRIHLLASMETSLYRALRALRFPFRQIGPLTDYYGPVMPFYMSVEDMEVTLYENSRDILEYFNHELEPCFKCPLIEEEGPSL